MKRKQSIKKPMIQEERLCQWLVCGWDEETFERDESWFQGVYKPLPHEDMGTIQMLRDDVKKQQQELKENNHDNDFLSPWGAGYTTDNISNVVFTQDGAFIWDARQDDYQQVFIVSMYEKDWMDTKGYFSVIAYK